MDNQPSEDSKKPISITFTSEDIKLLVITFAGTVAANLVTVVLVGLAIATAHSVHLFRAGAVGYTIIALTTLAVIMFPSMVVSLWRGRRTGEKKLLISLISFAAIGPVMIVLTWVGVAAGIK